MGHGEKAIHFTVIVAYDNNKKLYRNVMVSNGMTNNILIY